MQYPSLIEPLISKKVVYKGKYIQTEEHVVLQPDGNKALREIVTPPNAVGIFPIDPDETVYLVRQYRPAIQQITLEIPAGVLDPGEQPRDTALRECEEEIGVTASKMDFLFSYFHSVGFSTGKIDIFMATDFRPAPNAHTDPGEFIEKVAMPFDELYKKCTDGTVIDSKTLLAVFWYLQRVRNPSPPTPP
ncbi:MAG: NUDIX hydrolase [Nitrospirota bacterium]